MFAVLGLSPVTVMIKDLVKEHLNFQLSFRAVRRTLEKETKKKINLTK